MWESVLDARMSDLTPMNWEHFSEETDLLESDWVFRGHAKESWLLRTTLDRHTPPEITRAAAESTLLTEFQKRAPRYVPPGDRPTNKGDWLALMQHFGAPTRLLDVTKSPFVALYFAVEDATDHEPCAVGSVLSVVEK
jgi:hypothetical protein